MIDMHRLVLFFHVAGAMGAFATLAIEWLGLRGLRRATTYEQARDWMDVWRRVPAVGAPSVAVLLLSGIYLATSLGLWNVSWVAIGIPALVVIAVAGGITAPSRGRARAALAAGTGLLPEEIQTLLQAPLWQGSLRVRTVLVSGVLFAMTSKPEAAYAVILATTAIALLWGLASLRGRTVPGRATS